MGVVSGLDHFTIATNRGDETIQFFVDVLGLESRPEDRPDFGFPGAWLWSGDRAIVHLVFADEDPGTPTGSIDHVAFATDDLDGFVTRLDELGVPYRHGQQPDLGLEQAFLTDPNGVRIEVTLRR